MSIFFIIYYYEVKDAEIEIGIFNFEIYYYYFIYIILKNNLTLLNSKRTFLYISLNINNH